jgi:hypothetical protein
MTSSPYATLQKLTPTGRSKPVPIVAADRYLQTHPEDPNQLFQSQDPIALLCLRCFISHTIVTTIRSLVNQFGKQHQFKEEDLLPIVLDDDGSPDPSPYKPLSFTILETFDPKSGTLTNWTIRHVRQHPELKRKLLEQGVYLISPWALLNDTKPDRLRTIFTDLHLLDRDILQAQNLLTAYRAIYLPDRIKARTRKTCIPPTTEQLIRISTELEKLSQTRSSPESILNQLEALSNKIRQHRMKLKVGIQSDRSLDDPNFKLPAESECLDEPQETAQTDFLRQYRNSFSTVLTHAITSVINDRIVTTPKKATQFLIALQAYYCKNISMGEIATLIGIRSQDAVSRLIRLKDLRSDIRRHMLSNLKAAVLTQAAPFLTAEALKAADRALETALDEQLETLMQAEAQRDKTPKGLQKGETRLSIALCHHLDQRQESPENSS